MRAARLRRLPAEASLLDIATGRVGKSAESRIAGARARQAGVSLEASLKAANDWYDREQVAAVEKLHAPVAGWGESLHVQASNVDYLGTWYRPEFIGNDGARRDGALVGIAFDAKSVAGAASFGVTHVGGGKHEARNRARFLRQVEYLRARRDRHDYVAGFLLYCAQLDTLWWCDDLDALARGESVRIRTKQRGAGIVHHLPHLAEASRAHPSAPAFNYLALVLQSLSDRTSRPYFDRSAALGDF